MSKHFWKNQQGSMAVIIALLLPTLLGFTGIVLDLGNLAVVRTRMQNAVDTAVCAGGLKLPSTDQATTQAQQFITNNGFDQTKATVTFTKDAVKNPSNAPQINCSLTNDVSTYFMGLLGFKTVTLNAAAEAILIQSSPGGPFNYTMFSGSETLDLTVNGSQTVKGSIHSNDHILINGSSNVSGAVEGQKGVTINGSNTIGSVSADTLQHISITGSNNIGSQSAGALDIAMPDYSAQISTNAAHQYTTNQTFNGTVDVTDSIYVQGTATLNGSINSTGSILATGDITVNGTSSISGSNQVCLYSANGNITINGSSFIGDTASQIIYAPNGTITINGSFTFHGRIIGKKVTVNGSGNFNGADYPVTSIPGKSHVKLIG